MRVTKALVLHQPYATGAVLGLKLWETRGQPFAGEMCPPGVRPLPGCRVERGERIAIVAGRKVPTPWWSGVFGSWTTHDPVVTLLPEWELRTYGSVLSDGELNPDRHAEGLAHWLPLGAVVGTVRVVDALPILPEADDYSDGRACIESYSDESSALLRLWEEDADAPTANISGQLPWGDWRPGRWAMELADPVACDPIPVTGRQGVFRLPDEVADQVNGDEG